MFGSRAVVCVCVCVWAASVESWSFLTEKVFCISSKQKKTLPPLIKSLTDVGETMTGQQLVPSPYLLLINVVQQRAKKDPTIPFNLFRALAKSCYLTGIDLLRCDESF